MSIGAKDSCETSVRRVRTCGTAWPSRFSLDKFRCSLEFSFLWRMPGVNRQGQAHIVSTAIVSPGSGKGGREVEATPSFRTWFSIDPQPASISPTINISIVFICAFLVDCGRTIRIRQSKTILARSCGAQRASSKLATKLCGWIALSLLPKFELYMRANVNTIVQSVCAEKSRAKLGSRLRPLSLVVVLVSEKSLGK